VFEPFFTTKPDGVGTGLGLTISREIVNELGGELRAENHPDGGACFVIELPAATPGAHP
jgi:two-component system C4-dicarboxylate transport sensor histidine kinase DctB